MKYEVVLEASATRDLRRIGQAEAQRIRSRLAWLADHLDETSAEMLAANLHGLLKLRAGDYRVAYTVDRQSNTIHVHMVGHRSDVYDIDGDADR